MACCLLKHAHWQQDTRGADVGLHYIRTKDDSEVDFCLGDGDTLTHLVESKRSDSRLHRALDRFAAQRPQAQAVHLLRDCQAEANTGTAGRVHAREAAAWLAGLAV